MIGNSLLTQIIVAGLAIGIIITYIQPTIGEIKSRQDEIAKTQEELQKINAVNSRLAALVSQVNAISQRDKQALNAYLPETADEVRVMKDISTVANSVPVLIMSLGYDGSEEMKVPLGAEAVPATVKNPMVHAFTFDFVSSYEQLKSFLNLIEKNNYPLEVKSISVTPTEGGLLDVGMEIVTYSHR